MYCSRDLECSRYFEILGFQVPQVCGRRQRRADAVHVVAQPVHHPAELARGDLLIERGMRGAHGLVELARDDRAECVGWKISEMAHRPMDVLQAALDVVRGTDIEPLLQVGVPG